MSTLLTSSLDERIRPFYSTHTLQKILQYVGAVDIADKNDSQELVSLVQDEILVLTKSMIEKAKQFNVTTIDKSSKKTFSTRVSKLENLVEQAIEAGAEANIPVLKKSAQLLLRQLMATICQTVKRNDTVSFVTTDQAVKLLFEIVEATLDENGPEANQLKANGVTVKFGCGDSGQVFFEKHDGEEFEVFIYNGLFSELMCKYFHFTKDKDNYVDHTRALLQLTSSETSIALTSYLKLTE